MIYFFLKSCDSYIYKPFKFVIYWLSNIQCYIDGPYGTATREIFDTEHAVLIAAGIGVTPMASILQSAMYRYKASMSTCPRCQHSFYGPVSDQAMALKKVYQHANSWLKYIIPLYYEKGDQKKEISMHQTINISKVSLQKLLQMNLILGWFYLDKPRAEIIRMVLRATEPHWNGAV